MEQPFQNPNPTSPGRPRDAEADAGSAFVPAFPGAEEGRSPIPEPVPDDAPEPSAAPNRTKRRVWLVAAVLICAALLGVLLGAGLYDSMHPVSRGDEPGGTDGTGESAAPSTEPEGKTMMRILDENRSAVVRVTAAQENDPLSSVYLPAENRSGFLISEDGYILTAGTAFTGETGRTLTVKVAFDDGREADASLIAADPETGLTLLKVKRSGLSAVSASDAGVPADSGEYSLIAAGEKSLRSCRTLRINAEREDPGGTTVFYAAADDAFDPEASGSPVFDSFGRLTGVLFVDSGVSIPSDLFAESGVSIPGDLFAESGVSIPSDLIAESGVSVPSGFERIVIGDGSVVTVIPRPRVIPIGDAVRWVRTILGDGSPV